ncbi:hypothetical protein AB4354_01770 [Vibrio splendidus]|uniref:hypothetical protein n=1 Tax=Vibrio splendidus TaxID=29497 RepID=UPI000C84EADB|nr:hypothetical protein [Vibrio splendidus]PMH03014.1 hypothetical protein BCU75_05030 [Vibrio splendidus]
MSNEFDDVEPGDDIEPSTTNATTKPARKEYSKLATELTNDELSSSGVQKMFLAEISRLETLINRIDKFRDKFYDADKKLAVSLEKEKTHKFSEILYSVSLTLGAVLLGFSPSLDSTKNQPLVIGGIGLILVAGAIVAKLVKK